MQSLIDSQAKRSNQIEDFYNECLDKAVNRIKRTYNEERCTSMVLKVDGIAELKGFLPPYSMRDLVKVIRFGLEKAGVKVHRCHDPHHLSVEWRGVLKKSAQPSDARATPSIQKHAAADGGARFIFEGERGGVPMLDVLINPAKCKQAYLCKQEVKHLSVAR
jgi:hypothetical protein